MTPQHIYSIICGSCTIVQAVAAALFIYDRRQPKRGSIMSSKGKALALSMMLPALCVVLGVVTHWLWTYQPPTSPPVVIEKPAPIPCPPSQTGNATTHGKDSAAVSGNGNTTNVGTTPAAPPK